jgi:ketosteroid isomerase-like protein
MGTKIDTGLKGGKPVKPTNHFKLTLGLLALLVSVGVLLIAAESGSALQNEEAAVRDVLLRSASSFAKNDIAEATKVWANDESLTIFESGHANYGWADYRDNHLGPEMKEMKNTKYEFSDMKIHLAGKTAWATLKYTISADIGEAGKTRHVEGGGLGTAILEKRSDGWRIVHWHSSAPRRAPAAAASPSPKP